MSKDNKLANLVARKKENFGKNSKNRWLGIKTKLFWIAGLYGKLVLLAILLQVAGALAPQLKEQMPEFYRNVDLVLASAEQLAKLCRDIVEVFAKILRGMGL